MWNWFSNQVITTSTAYGLAGYLSSIHLLSLHSYLLSRPTNCKTNYRTHYSHTKIYLAFVQRQLLGYSLSIIMTGCSDGNAIPSEHVSSDVFNSAVIWSKNWPNP